MAVRKKIAARKKISVEDQEKMLAALQQKDEKVSNDVSTKKAEKTKASNKTQRVTVDFPQAMYEQMKEETQMNGQTLRGFVVSLVRKHLANREE
jgi:hypothetical protein